MEKKIKVTQVSRHAYPFIGGVEAVIKQICDSLSDYEFDKEILTCSNTEKSSMENGIKYNRCKYLFEFASNPISPSFIWELAKVDTDVLHYHMPLIFAVIAHFIARPKYKKMVVTYHSDIVGYDKIMAPFWPVFRKFLDKADAIHVLSDNVTNRSAILSNFSIKTKAIPYSLDIEASKEYNEKLYEQIKSKFESKKILLYSGRFVYFKGLQYLIEAMKMIDDNVILLLVGSGKYKEDLYKQAEDLNLLNSKIFFENECFIKNDLQSYYKACDIFILPSILHSESFAIVQAEAMVHEKPVINTDLGTGVNYVSVHNETGLTVEPKNSKQLADAINLLLQDDELRLKLGKNARKRVEELFDIEKNKQKYWNVYKNLFREELCTK